MGVASLSIFSSVVDIIRNLKQVPDRTHKLKDMCDSAYRLLSEAKLKFHDVGIENSELKEEKKRLKKSGQDLAALTKEIAKNKKQLTELKKTIRIHMKTLHDAYPVFAASYVFDQQNPELKGRYGEREDPQFQIQRIPVYIDDTNHVVHFGSFQFAYPEIHFLREKDSSLKLKIMKANGLEMPPFDYDINYGALELIGVVNHANNFVSSLLLGSKFNDYFRRVNYYIWCAHDEERIKRFCKSRKYLIPEMVYRYNRFHSLIKKAIDNQEEQIIPAILFFGKSVAQLKNGLGSALWKKIVKSSPTRNTLIFSRLMILLNKSYFPDAKHYGVYKGKRKPRLQHLNIGDFKQILELLYDFPSSFLKMSFFYNYTNYRNDVPDLIKIHTYLQSGIWAIANGSYDVSELEHRTNAHDYDRYNLSTKKSSRARIMYLKSEVMNRLSNQFTDTKRMAENLDRPFNPVWSARRMHREHENLTREGLKARVKNRRFNFKKDWPQSIEIGNVKATLLDTTHSLIFEGSEMRHCVGSYSDIVDSGSSIIYSLTTEQSNEVFRSTLQLAVRPNGVNPVQNRSVYNERPIQLLIDAAPQVAAEINRWLAKK